MPSFLTFGGRTRSTIACLLTAIAVSGCGTPDDSKRIETPPDDPPDDPDPIEAELCEQGVSTPVSPTTDGTRTEASADAIFDVDASLSSAMATVGIVEWSVDKPIRSARIEFGRDPDSPEYVAPVDLTEDGFRTLLLGMKPATTYTLRVVATGCEDELYVSHDVELETDFLPNGLPPVTVNDVDTTAVFPGFTILCNGYGNARNLVPNAETSWVLILDRDGDYVWAHNLLDSPVYGCSQARMSADGEYVWAGNTSTVQATGALRRVSMDGLEVEDYDLPARHHDFTVLPNGHILYFEQQNGGGVFDDTEGPDSIMSLDPETGETTLVYDETVDFADLIESSGGAHTNSITYVSHLDAFSFSLLRSNTIALLSYPDAELLGVFNGPMDEFGVSWNTQHGHEFVEDRLLVFNNWSAEGNSALLEFTYDLETKTAGPIETYRPVPSFGTIAFGGVQRLPNGNSVVTFSSNGVIHEIDPDKVLVREIVVSDSIGYTTKRATLYGPPPHLAAE